jgi:flagellar biosynthesis protein FliQ
MTSQFVIHMVGQALMAAFWICAPLLVISFVVSVVINLIQIATSMQDAVFSTVPRLLACLGGLLLLMPWMFHRAIAYATSVFGDLARYAQ